MSKEAMKLALEALENIEERCTLGAWEDDAGKAITALKEALAEQPAQQEPWCMKMNGCKTKCEDCPVQVAQPEQEPVATLFGSLPVYDTSPPAQRKPLTDEERDAMINVTDLSGTYYYDDLYAVILAAEGKLAEKNA